MERRLCTGTITHTLLVGAIFLTFACSKEDTTTQSPVTAKHEHHPPHGGTPVVLGDELYHLEFVRDTDAGALQVYVLDGELENFIRCAMPAFEIAADVDGTPTALVFQAVANPATGETVGDTALFEAHADWLKNTHEFNATLKTITIRGTTFNAVEFNFPRGNETD